MPPRKRAAPEPSAEDVVVADADAGVGGLRAEAAKLVEASRSLFSASGFIHANDPEWDSAVLRDAVKTDAEYGLVKEMPAPAGVGKSSSSSSKSSRTASAASARANGAAGAAGPVPPPGFGVGSGGAQPVGAGSQNVPAPPPSSSANRKQPAAQESNALIVRATEKIAAEEGGNAGTGSSFAIVPHKKLGTFQPKPKWHPPWKLMRVIAGHQGWVRAVAVDVANEWFATGSVDRTLKIWDLASGELKLTLTGHISTIRGIAISPRHPYLFTCGEDKQVKCWDLEQNKVVRHYHGHLSGVYCISMHPTLDVLCTGGRDAAVRVWDIRTKREVHVLASHKDTVASVSTMSTNPQVISGSMDSTVKLWDLRQGTAYTTLTHHKKAVRAIVNHPTLHAFASGSADNIKQWKCPQGEFIQNMSGHRAIINTLSMNQDGVVASCADNGSMQFWDWQSAYSFSSLQTRVQPGSLDSEAGIFCSTFDQTGCRFITGEADKSIKVWKEDEDATPETHPINFQPQERSLF